MGVGAAGTSVLTLLAARTDARRRAPGATILWLLMIAGIVLTSAVASKLLDPFSPGRLIAVTAGVAAVAVSLASLAVLGIEGEGQGRAAIPVTKPRFGHAMREVWAEPQSRRFAVFVFVSMLAYSAQEVVLEPFAGAVFGATPGQTALFNQWDDAVECARCGGRMVRTGSCYTCRDCGTNTGCS